MENNIINIEEVLEYFEWKVEIGEPVSIAMIQRKFRSGYSTAQRTLEKLVELSYVEFNEESIIKYTRKK